MWEAKVGGRQLHFQLAGINNQNFIMRDQETGSWWQQVTGEAILGPLKGQRLKPVFHEELTFATWKREKPQGRVLRPDEGIARSGQYAPANWEENMASVPVATSQILDKSLEPRTLIIGLTVNGVSKAYPYDAVVRQSPIMDDLGGLPIFVVVGDDKRSVRAFERTVDLRKLEFFVKPGSSQFVLVDAETGSEWDFTGHAISGPLSGRQLKKVAVLSDYWFDWKAYHPNTFIYELGDR
ncbi:MAG: DUF3179 domain-containing protein [Pyrinomonadaceae bacterium]|nr:DUF3179 domain-containing protein [Pyrinomonadaceae bacterium]